MGEEAGLRGVTVTLDAGNISREKLLAQPGADTLAMIQRNAGAAYDWIARDANFAGPAAHRASHRWQAGHVRWERRELKAVAVQHADWLPLPGGQQAFRVQHRARKTRRGPTTPETLHGFPSLKPERASGLRRLRLPRGPGTVANRNHFPRDVMLGEEDIRTGHGPCGHAALYNLALLLPSGQGETLPLAHCSVRRTEALPAPQ